MVNTYPQILTIYFTYGKCSILIFKENCSVEIFELKFRF